MGWFVGLLFGALIGAGAWVTAQNAAARALPGDSWRAGAPAEAGNSRPLPVLRPTRAPDSEPGSEGDERQIRPPVQRGPDDFYRKPPRERKPKDKMYADLLSTRPDRPVMETCPSGESPGTPPRLDRIAGRGPTGQPG